MKASISLSYSSTCAKAACPGLGVSGSSLARIAPSVLWVVALLNYMDRQMLSTMKNAMMIDIMELEKAENFGRLMAVFLWIYGLMSPVAGIIGDRLNRKWLIVGSLFVWSGVTFAMGYTDDYNVLYGLRAIMGVSEAMARECWRSLRRPLRLREARAPRKSSNEA